MHSQQATQQTTYGARFFDIDSSDEDRLDRAEGLGYGYERKSVDVESTVGRISVFTYVASGVEAINPI